MMKKTYIVNSRKEREMRRMGKEYRHLMRSRFTKLMMKKLKLKKNSQVIKKTRSACLMKMSWFKEK